MSRIWPRLTAGVVASILAILPAGAGEGDKSSASDRVLEFQVVGGHAKEPLAGVKLEIRIDRETRSDVTNEQGRCRIGYGSRQPEYLSVRASGPGLVPLQVAWRTTEPSVKIPGAYTLAMEPGTSIGGILQDEEGKPIEGAVVCLLVPSDGQIERVSIWDHREKTDAQGRWRCDIMPARLDDVWMRLEHPDYVSDEMYGKTPKPPMERLRDLTGVMVMKKGITVAGRVTNMDGRPIEGAKVAQGSDRFGTEYPSTRTDGEGRFEFKNARPEQMVLTVQARGYSPELEQIVPQAGLTPVEIRLDRGRTLRGRIVDKAGNPVAGAFVAADTWRGHRSLEWRVDTDVEGRFRWDEAPADQVLIDMGKQHYMSVRHHGMTASDQEYTITMHPVLRIKGQIADQETGQPIPRFTVCPGIDWGDGRAIYWDRRQVKPFADGAYEITFGEPRPAHFFLVEAEGYLPGVSRSFDDGEGEVAYDLALKKGRGPGGTIHFADGQPVMGGEVILCTPAQTVFIRNGRNVQRSDNVSVQTGADGRFSFPAQADAYSLIVLHDRGFAEMTENDLAQSSKVTLQSWGRVEGRVLIGSGPGADQEVRILFDRPFDRNAPRVQLNSETVTDKQGHFVLDRVPPGKARACRVIRRLFCHDVPIEVKAGETTNVTIGGVGRPVIGKIAIADSVKDKIDWETLDCYASKQAPEGPYRTLGVLFQRDGSFRIDDVPAGDYCLYLTAYAPAKVPRSFRGELIGRMTQSFTIPDVPGGRSDEPLDLGVLDLLTAGGTANIPILTGKAIPDLKDVPAAVSPDQTEGKPLLICFFDMGQRPSRNAVLQLAKQAEILKAAGVVPVVVQASRTDEAALKEWFRQSGIPFPVGMASSDENKIRSAWGVRSLPWLILTDAQHMVRAEGFAVGDIEQALEKIK